MVNIISSTVPSSSITATASAISLRRLRPDDVHAQNLAVFRIGDNLHKAVVAAHDRRLGVAGEGKLAHLDFVAFFFGLRLSQARRANLRLGIGAARNAIAPHRPVLAPRNLRHGHHAAHRAHVRQLRQPGHNVANGKHARLGRLLRFINLHQPALQLNLRLLQANVSSSPRAPHSHQHLLGFFHLRLSIRIGIAHAHAVRGLLHLLHLRAGVHVDAALLEDPRQLL